MTKTLTHLDRLEAESIHILREVMADAARPVMLYSVGKDSAVMLHLARKARSEEHTSELQSLMRLSYAVFCLKKQPHDHTLSRTYTPKHHQVLRSCCDQHD